MRGVAHMKASCCTYARVIHVARVHEACEYDLNQGRHNRERDRERYCTHVCMSRCIYECVMSLIGIMHVTVAHLHQSRHTHELVMSHICMSQVTHMNMSSHIYERVVSLI